MNKRDWFALGITIGILFNIFFSLAVQGMSKVSRLGHEVRFASGRIDPSDLKR
jgi:hypothetical protein